MKHNDPVLDGRRDGMNSSSTLLPSPPERVPTHETLLNALRLHHLSALEQQQQRARRYRGFPLPPLVSPPPSPPSDEEDLFGTLSWLSSPTLGLGLSDVDLWEEGPTSAAPRRMHHPSSSPTASTTTTPNDGRRRHLVNILSAALDELGDAAESVADDPLDGDDDGDELEE